MYPRDTPSSSLRHPSGRFQVGVVVTVALATVLGLLGLADALRAFEARADHYASLGSRQRAYGVQRTAELWPPQDVVDAALATMPRDATFRVAFGPGWRADRARWTNDLTTGFLRYHLLPRREGPDAEWVFCFACDVRKLGRRFQAVAESADGLRFGKVDG